MLTREWDCYLAQIPESKKDIYYSEGYVRSQAMPGDIPECFVYEEQDQIFLCPYFKKKVFWFKEEVFDFETPYGYGGPISNTDESEFLARAVDQMASELRDNGFIAGFLRFHPLLGNQILLSGRPPFEVSALRETVVLDLSLSEDEFWREQIHVKHRNSIRQAQRAGLEFKLDEQWAYLDDFRVLYEATMHRVDADEFYFFDRKYFESMSRLSPSTFIGAVLRDGRCLSAAIFMCHGSFGHYHLSASDREAQLWRPNNFMIYEAALAFRKRGVRWFHLGGAQENELGQSLFQFKSRFSRLRRDFFIGKVVLDKARYEEACARWESSRPEKKEAFGKFFLKYRFNS